MTVIVTTVCMVVVKVRSIAVIENCAVCRDVSEVLLPADATLGTGVVDVGIGTGVAFASDVIGIRGVIGAELEVT